MVPLLLLCVLFPSEESIIACYAFVLLICRDDFAVYSKPKVTVVCLHAGPT